MSRLSPADSALGSRSHALDRMMLYNLPETGVTDACQRAWLQKVLRNPVCGVLPARAGTWSRHCSNTSAASRSTSPSPAPHVVAGAYGKTPEREKFRESSGTTP